MVHADWDVDVDVVDVAVAVAVAVDVDVDVGVGVGVGVDVDVCECVGVVVGVGVHFGSYVQVDEVAVGAVKIDVRGYVLVFMLLQVGVAHVSSVCDVLLSMVLVHVSTPTGCAPLGAP